MAYIEQEKKSIRLNPTSGFVVKSRIIGSEDLSKHGISTKVFINICHDSQVPKPETEFNPEVVFPLIIENKWEIPLIVSSEKRDKDKKGIPSLVYDCCINTKCFQWCQIYDDLRKILIEWCLEAIELLYEVALDRDYSIPKMLSKGSLSPTVIQEDELDESGFQKKLQKLKHSEALGIIEELNEEQMPTDSGPLPDLRDISGKKKPSIEEITDMSISDSGKVQPPMPPKPTSMPNFKKADQVSKKQHDFSISYQTLDADYSLLVKIESLSLRSRNIKLQYSPVNMTLVLYNLDPSYYFTKSSPNELEIPLPNVNIQDPSNIKSFDVRSEITLYIFV